MRSWVMDMFVLLCFQNSLTDIFVSFCCIWLREEGLMNELYYDGFEHFIMGFAHFIVLSSYVIKNCNIGGRVLVLCLTDVFVCVP